MSADTIKRLAADIMKVGKNRVRIKEGEYARAMEALTREDVKGLIDDGAVYSLKYVGERKKPVKKRKGPGKRKGKKYSRKGKKESWMEKVRSQRKYLKELLESGELPAEHRRNIYLKIKGGSFRGKKALLTYLKENEYYAEPKAKPKKAEKPAEKETPEKPEKEVKE